MTCPQIARFVGNTSPDAIQDVRRGLRKWMRRSRILRIYAITGATVRPQPGPGYLPDIGVGRRLRALLAMGWRPQDLAAAGVDPALITHTPGWVDQDTHRLVCRAYDELGMRLGPSPEMLVTLEDVHPDRGCCRPWGESAPYGTAIHLVLRDPHALARPVRYQGRLGLWDLELPVAAQVLSLAYPTSSGVYVGA